MTCPHCGDLHWTLVKYGRITHKEGCPHRVEIWSQTYPHRNPRDPEREWS